MVPLKTLNVKEVCTAHEAILALIKDDRENKFVFPSAVRIKLAGNLRKTRPVYDDYKAQQIEVYKKHGEVVLKDGKPTDAMQLRPENMEVAQKELADVLLVDTFQTLNPITVKDLGENQIDIDLITVLQATGLLEE